MRDVEFGELTGKVITGISGLTDGSDEVVFDTDGGRYKMYHEQDCCECVQVCDVCGDADTIIGAPVLMADEVSASKRDPEDDDSQTWTFYRISTFKGTVVIRWLGSSNGYYSERVDFAKLRD